MALNIDGTTGISGVDGSASAPALQGTDSNTGINFGSDTVNINTGGTTRATVESNGRLGIGTTSPACDLHVSAANPRARFTSTGNSVNYDIFMGSSNPTIGTSSNHDFAFMSNDSERMRIDSSGMLSINSTSGSLGGEKLFVKHGGASANVAGFFFNNTQDRTNLMIKHDRAVGGTAATMIDFIDQLNGSSGSIVSNGSSTAYNTSSDYRLKENAVAISDGITRLKTLKPYRFNFKVDPTKTVDGFFAHEVTAVPEAVQGEKDEMQPLTYYTDENTIPSGKQVGDAKTFSETEIRPQSIDHSKLVPLLTAALQEAVAKIEVLETKVAALEAG